MNMAGRTVMVGRVEYGLYMRDGDAGVCVGTTDKEILEESNGEAPTSPQDSHGALLQSQWGASLCISEDRLQYVGRSTERNVSTRAAN